MKIIIPMKPFDQGQRRSGINKCSNKKTQRNSCNRNHPDKKHRKEGGIATKQKAKTETKAISATMTMTHHKDNTKCAYREREQVNPWFS
jgi:hypothetical protein